MQSAERHRSVEAAAQERTLLLLRPHRQRQRDRPPDPLMEEEHGVVYGPPYVEQLSPIISLLISYVLPVIIMVVLFSFLFHVLQDGGRPGRRGEGQRQGLCGKKDRRHLPGRGRSG